MKSKHSNELEVLYRKGRYMLCSKNAVYSFEDLYSNFRDSFNQIPLDKYPIQNVLVLGFGLGSVPLMLERVFNKNYHYTAVEIDEVIIEMANSYSIPSLNSPIDLYCEDAFDFVAKNKNYFDLIIVDLFIDAEVPSKFEQVDFLANLKKSLSPNGLLLFNRLSNSEDNRNASNIFYNNSFKTVFNNCNILELKGNKMLLGQH